MRFDSVECMIEDCEEEPEEDVLIDIEGLVLRFAVCGVHFEVMRFGLCLESPASLTRGLIGPG